MPGIGATLREARMRARIDISEIEAQTKIRAKYLRALENEEWDLLPGPTFVKSFLRTYADALGLDSRQVVEDYRHTHERPSDAEMQPIVALGNRPRRGPPRPSAGRGFLIAVALFGALIVVLAVLLVVGLLTGASKKVTPTAPPAARAPAAPRHPARHPAVGPSPLVSLQLRPTAAVYVCLLGSAGRRLLNGVIIGPGRPQPVYRANRFTVTLGNSSVRLRVNGHDRAVVSSAGAVGYTINAGGLRALASAQLPTCR